MPFFSPILLLRQTRMVALCTLSLVGCAQRGSIDLLESELRKQEQAQSELTAQLSQARDDLKVAQRDANGLRSQLAENQQVALTSEQADVFYRLEALKFNMLLTSGYDRDGLPGDDGLSVLLMPVDVHGDLVKLAGEIELELFDMTLPAEEQRLGQWRFTTDEVREHWHKALFSTGYLFKVDWPRIPVSSELTLHARMVVSDGRKFDATTQVKVSPPTRGPALNARIPEAAPPRATQKRKPGSSPANRVVPAAGRAKVGQVTPASASKPALKKTPALPVAETPRIRPSQAPGPGHGAPPTQTSDNLTDETIPQLR